VTDGVVPEIVVDGVTKRYGRTLALDDVGLAVRRNELFALALWLADAVVGTAV
jgi:ABC-type sugar transport system ATPase subunit